MNKNKKLIIFSSISVILMLALIGGTLAWFYLNEEVSVSYGNSIFCEAGNSLEIALVEGGTPSKWSSSIDCSSGQVTTLDISGDGYHLYRPSEIDEWQQPINFTDAVSSLEDSEEFDYIELELAFRSLSEMKVYLSEESFVLPADPEDDGENIYGPFSRDYIAGAMRVAVIEGSQVKMLWAPNPEYQLIENSNGTYSFNSGEDGTSVPEEYYSYFYQGSNGRFLERDVTSDEYASKQYVVGSTGAKKGYTGNSGELISLCPQAEGEYDQKTVKIRIWFEGTDREAHQALAGGNVNVRLKFVGVYKEQADAEKQDAIDAVTFDKRTYKFSGVAQGMVYSVDGRNWTEVDPASPVISTSVKGSYVYIKYPETDLQHETAYKRFSLD